MGENPILDLVFFEVHLAYADIVSRRLARSFTGIAAYQVCMDGFLWYFHKINYFISSKILVSTQKFLGVGVGTPLPPKIFLQKC